MGAKTMPSLSRAHGVVVSHLLSMREALGSIPSVSIIAPHPNVSENSAEAGDRVHGGMARRQSGARAPPARVA